MSATSTVVEASSGAVQTDSTPANASASFLANGVHIHCGSVYKVKDSDYLVKVEELNIVSKTALCAIFGGGGLAIVTSIYRLQHLGKDWRENMNQQSKVQKLFDKAKGTIEHQEMQVVNVFYRNKRKAYYDEILGTSGIMETHRKDLNGDKDCPINGQIEGIFFSANNPGVFTCRVGYLPSRSPFGDQRLIVPTSYFGNNFNLYFADFYCNSMGAPHYVTVVMANPNSYADNFCAQLLVKLDVYDNPFLKRVGSEWRATRGVWVELFYTEDVNLDFAIYFHGASFESVVSTGVATPLGIPKNTRCRICNVTPVHDNVSDDDYGAYGGWYSAPDDRGFIQ